MIWNKTMECMNREDMRKLQGIRLKKTVERVYHNGEPYRKRMQENGITPDDTQTIDDVVKLPFTSKKDLRDYYPFDFIECSHVGDCPFTYIVWNYRKTDSRRLYPQRFGYMGEVGAHCLSAYSLGKQDVVQVS
jgi:phenylacetate-CoA ligase